MPICNLDQLRALVPPGKRLMGVDVGSTTLGLAVSDAAWRVAASITTLHRGKLRPDLEKLFALAQERDVAGYVLGLPMEMDGKEGTACQSVRSFAFHMMRQGQERAGAPVPVALFDERLSTAAVTRAMLAEDVSRRRRAAAVDAAAASYILQGALDRMQSLGSIPAVLSSDLGMT
ncbi:MAG: Holliday junction resolvase RuvX [Alphaproteobacteria bacterium]|nr:MAG: Holliday junction resolvase RuvX [Alphaproteobacteria bacterium]